MDTAKRARRVGQFFAWTAVLIWRVVDDLVLAAPAVTSCRFWASLGADGLIAGYVVYQLVVLKRDMRARATGERRNLKASEAHCPDDQSPRSRTQNRMR